MELSYAGIGARKTPAEVCDVMRAFAAGAGQRREIYLPWAGYNGHPGALADNGIHVIGSGEAGRALERVAETHHPAWERCTQGVRRLHARNVAILLGAQRDKPVSAVLCWTPGGGVVGGTGMGLRIAQANRIPVFNLALLGAGEIKEALGRLVQLRSAPAGRRTACATLQPTI